MRKLIIAGVDPGTTVGYAFLDLDGKVIGIGSQRNLNFRDFLSLAIEKGDIVIVGADKANPPSFVERLANKVGARLITPDHDLDVREKRDITKKHKTQNDHEMDALASAIFAYDHAKKTIEKTKDIPRDAAKFALKKGDINIPEAVRITRPKKKTAKPKPKPKPQPKKDPRITELEKTKEILQNQNTKLKKKAKDLEKEVSYLKKNLSKNKSSKKMKRLLSLRNRKIKNLHNELLKTKAENKKMRELLSNAKDKIVLKKLKSLEYDEYLKKKELIRKGDILYVKDLRYDKKTIDALRGKVDTIVYDNGREDLDFELIPSKKITLEESKDFVLADPEEIKKHRDKDVFLRRIVKDYRSRHK